MWKKKMFRSVEIPDTFSGLESLNFFLLLFKWHKLNSQRTEGTLWRGFFFYNVIRNRLGDVKYNRNFVYKICVFCPIVSHVTRYIIIVYTIKSHKMYLIKGVFFFLWFFYTIRFFFRVLFSVILVSRTGKIWKLLTNFVKLNSQSLSVIRFAPKKSKSPISSMF